MSGRRRAKVNLKPGVGTGLAISPDGHRAVGRREPRQAARRRSSTSPRSGSSRACAPVAGPGAPGYATEDSRLYIGDGGDETVSVFSTLSYKRLGVQRLGKGRTRARSPCSPASP